MRPDPPKEENRVWRCENKQLDPEMKIMSTILDSQARKPGLGREKYASRPARGRKPGLEMEKYAARPGNENYVNYFGQSSPETGSGEKKIYSQTREAQDSIRFPSPPASSPLAFRHPT